MTIDQIGLRITATLFAVGLITYLLLMAAFVVVHEDLKPCPTEDSVHCTWYGPVQGNGEGDIVRHR